MKCWWCLKVTPEWADQEFFDKCRCWWCDVVQNCPCTLETCPAESCYGACTPTSSAGSSGTPTPTSSTTSSEPKQKKSRTEPFAAQFVVFCGRCDMHSFRVKGGSCPCT